MPRAREGRGEGLAVDEGGGRGRDRLPLRVAAGHHRVAGPYDLVVVLDGDRRRLVPQVDAAFKSAKSTAILDHHGSTTPEGYTFAFLDPKAASTCEMVDGVLQDWKIPLDRDIAALLYTGLIFDTGGFRHSNTNASTHAFAAR